MKRSGLDRALRYFFRQAQIYVFWVAAGSLFMCIYVWLLNGSLSFKEMLSSMPFVILFISWLCIFTSGMSIQTGYSMLVSLGCRRINAFLGNLVMDGFIAAESLVLYKIAQAVWKQGIGLAAVIFAYFIIEGITKLIGTVMIKWGRIAYFISLGVIMAFGAGFGVVLGEAGFWGSEAAAALISSGRIGIGRKLLLAASGAAVCAAADYMAWRMLRHYEIKA